MIFRPAVLLLALQALPWAASAPFAPFTPFTSVPVGPFGPGDLEAQARTPGPSIQVMILGTYHFANPGLDVVQSEVADVMTPEKQEEIGRVVEALARFRPTRIAVEATEPTQERFDSLYRAYRNEAHALTRNERQQLGFRLAAMRDLPRVHAIDHGGNFPFQPLVEYAAEHEPERAQRIDSLIQWMGQESTRLQREMTVAEIFRHENDPERLAWGHGLYVDLLGGVGAGASEVGADLLAAWYERNIRIFNNLQGIAEPGDRVLVVFGSGHSPILRELVRAHPRMELVEPNDYLPER